MAPVAPLIRKLVIREIGNGPVIGIAVAGAVVGCVVLSAIIIFAICIHHHQAIARMTLERSAAQDLGGNVLIRKNDYSTVPRPKSTALRRSFFPLYNASAGWGALSSREDVHEQPFMTRFSKRISSTFATHEVDNNRLSWPLSEATPKCRKMTLKKVRHKHLSAIMESPRSERKPSPHDIHQPPNRAAPRSSNEVAGPIQDARDAEIVQQHAAPTPSGSPKSEASPSLALRPKPLFSRELDSEPQLTIIKRTTSERPKSDTIALPANALLALTSRPSRPQMHLRSISVCSQKSGLAPDEPIPPLPLNQELRQSLIQRRYSNIERSPSRHSAGSLESASSSILHKGLSPAIRQAKGLGAQDAADDDGAQVRSGPCHDWAMSVTSGPRPQREFSNVARFSMESFNSNRLSRTSTISANSGNENRLSVSQLKVADTVRLSRISSLSSISSAPNMSLQQVTTPKRPAQTHRVSVTGSPAERRKTSVLRDVSGNQIMPSRQASQNSLESSARSSGGNPFRWDPTVIITPLDFQTKPSALKGSPTARKGHKRQNCVRISTLAPTILGPQSKSPSPTRMNGIQEESPEQSSPTESPTNKAKPGLGFSNTRSLPTPPSSATFAPDIQLKPTCLRASVDSGSPTLSFTDIYGDRDDEVSKIPAFSSPKSSPSGRFSTRNSAASSVFTIPTFPSPAKNSTSALTTPIPVFSFTRPSMDEDGENTPPFAFDDVELEDEAPASSSPAFAFKPNKSLNDQHTAWPILLPTFNAEEYSQEYDPESPSLFYEIPEHPLEIDSPVLRPSSPPPLQDSNTDQTQKPDSPTLIPQSIPVIPVTIPGLTLYNPITNSPPLSNKTTRPDSTTLPLTPSPLNLVTLPPSCVPDSPTLPQTDTMDPASQRKISGLHGPRQAPGKDLRKSVIALRRMNSEVNTLDSGTSSRADRRYLRMGREASPALGGDSPDIDGERRDVDVGTARWSREGALQLQNQTPRKRKSIDGQSDATNVVERTKPERGARMQKTESSVWDDGEKFWESPPTVRFTGDGRPQRDGSLKGRNHDVHTPVGRATMKDIMGLKRASALGTGTPGSLYDTDGFLRT